MVTPERVNEIADQICGVVQKAGFDAADTSRKLAQGAASEVNARFVQSRIVIQPATAASPITIIPREQ